MICMPLKWALLPADEHNVFYLADGSSCGGKLSANRMLGTPSSYKYSDVGSEHIQGLIYNYLCLWEYRVYGKSDWITVCLIRPSDGYRQFKSILSIHHRIYFQSSHLFSIIASIFNHRIYFQSSHLFSIIDSEFILTDIFQRVVPRSGCSFHNVCDIIVGCPCVVSH